MPNSSSAGKKAGKGILPAVVTLLSIVLIISVILGGAFYIIIHNNTNGLGERYRKSIQNIPVLNLALPRAPDPTDPKYMTAAQIRAKYLEYKKLYGDLKIQSDNSAKQLAELQKYKDENEKEIQSIRDAKKANDDKQKQLDELKKTLDKMIATGDKTGFKQYFDTVDPAVAKEVYAEIVKQQQADQQSAQLALIYEAMDASAAAQIFEQMGNSKIDTIAQTLKAMKKENTAEILAAMSPDFASKVTDKLSALYKGN